MEKETAGQRPNCFQCAHFTITWDTKHPRACKLFGFKMAGLPSAMVFRSTGAECIAFVKKKDAGKEQR